MSQAWILAAARSPRLPMAATVQSWETTSAAMRAVQLPDPSGRRPLDAVHVAGVSGRALHLAAGGPADTPASTTDAGGLHALSLATQSVASGWSRRVLVAALTGAQPQRAGGSTRLHQTVAPASDAGAVSRLRRRMALDRATLDAHVERQAARRGAAADRGPGDLADLDVTPAALAPLCRAGGALLLGPADGLLGGRPAVARIVSARSIASDPADPFPALPLAAEQALREAGIGADALSAVQVAGPHAAVALLVEQSLGLDPDRVQPLGGPCARGFAGPAEGLLLLVEILDHLDVTGGRFGLIVEAGPWGMATAVVIDREQWT